MEDANPKTEPLRKIRARVAEIGPGFSRDFEFWMQEATARELGVPHFVIALIVKVGLQDHFEAMGHQILGTI